MEVGGPEMARRLLAVRTVADSSCAVAAVIRGTQPSQGRSLPIPSKRSGAAAGRIGECSGRLTVHYRAVFPPYGVLSTLLQAVENAAGYFMDGLVTYVSKLLDAKSAVKDPSMRVAAVSLFRHLVSRKSLEKRVQPSRTTSSPR